MDHHIYYMNIRGFEDLLFQKKTYKGKCGTCGKWVCNPSTVEVEAGWPSCEAQESTKGRTEERGEINKKKQILFEE